MIEKEKPHLTDTGVVVEKHFYDIKPEAKEEQIHLININNEKDIKLPHLKEERKEHHLKHEEIIQDDIEMQISLCGNKKELKSILVHIYNLLIDMPKEIKAEAMIRKLK